jgi:hypothetical protein
LSLILHPCYTAPKLAWHPFWNAPVFMPSFFPESSICLLCTLQFPLDYLISFVMGGAARAGQLSSFMHLSGLSRTIKFLYALAPPSPTVWSLKPPSWAHVHKTTCDLYSPVHNVLDACLSITWASGRGCV